MAVGEAGTEEPKRTGARGSRRVGSAMARTPAAVGMQVWRSRVRGQCRGPTPRPRSASARSSGRPSSGASWRTCPSAPFCRWARLLDGRGAHGRGGRGRVKTFTIGFAGHTEYDERAHARWWRSASRPSTRSSWSSRSARPRRPAGLAPRRAVRRLVGRADVPALGADTHEGDGCPQRDGGDEVFAGYLRLYGGASRSECRARRSGRWPGSWGSYRARRSQAPPPLRKRFAEVGVCPCWNATCLERVLHGGSAGFAEAGSGASLDRERLLESFRASYAAGEGSTLARLLQLNFETYLLDDLLVKMDRMSMAHGSRRGRPSSTRRSWSSARRCPTGSGCASARKVLLRRAMKGILPESILTRGRWASAPRSGLVPERPRRLRARALLDPASPIYEYLRPEPVAGLLQRHGAATADLSAQIWALLTLESWLRQERGWGAMTRKPAPTRTCSNSPTTRSGDRGRGAVRESAAGGAACELRVLARAEIGPPYQRDGGDPEAGSSCSSLNSTSWATLSCPTSRGGGARGCRRCRRARGHPGPRLGLRDPLALDREDRSRQEAAGLRSPRRGHAWLINPRRGRSRCSVGTVGAESWSRPTPTTPSSAPSPSTRSRSTSFTCGARSGPPGRGRTATAREGSSTPSRLPTRTTSTPRGVTR